MLEVRSLFLQKTQEGARKSAELKQWCLSISGIFDQKS